MAASQAGGREFESHIPLHDDDLLVATLASRFSFHPLFPSLWELCCHGGSQLTIWICGPGRTVLPEHSVRLDRTGKSANIEQLLCKLSNVVGPAGLGGQRQRRATSLSIKSTIAFWASARIPGRDIAK